MARRACRAGGAARGTGAADGDAGGDAAALQEQASAVAAGGAGETALLEGDSDSVASAALQEVLQAMFAQAGMQLNSVETLPGEEAGALSAHPAAGVVQCRRGRC